MAHPSEVFPKSIYILDGTNDLTLTDNHYVYAIYNPTGSAVTVDITGNLYTWQTDAYKELSSEKTSFPIASGSTLYGRFTNVESSAANVVCYVA